MIPLESTLADQELNSGVFRVIWSSNNQQLTVTHSGSCQILWQSRPEKPFLSAALKEDRFSESRGYFTLDQRSVAYTYQQTILSLEEKDGQIEINGTLQGSINSTYTIVLIAIDEKQLQMTCSLHDTACNHVSLSFATHPNNQLFGFGEQLTYRP